MTIRVTNISVHLDPPPISGSMLLHDDDTHTVVYLVVSPVDVPPFFVVDLPPGTTVRDDVYDYKREAERTLHSLLTLATREAAERDRYVSRLEFVYRMPNPDLDQPWQDTRWRYIRGDAGDIELATAAMNHAGPDDIIPPHDDPHPDGVDDNGKNWYLE